MHEDNSITQTMSNFQFRYPKNWDVKIEKENIVHILSGDGTDCRLNLYSSKNKVSLESELLRSINEFKVPITNYKTIDQSSCKIAGCEALAIKSEFLSNGDKLYATQNIIHIDDSTAMIVTAIYNGNDIKANEYLIRGITNSLSIDNKKMSQFKINDISN